MQRRLRDALGFVADIFTLFATGVAFVGAAIVGAVLTFKHAGIAWIVLAAVGAFFVLSSVVRFGLAALNARFDPVGEETYLRDKRIRIQDLPPPGELFVKGRILEHCRLIGPSVIALYGTAEMSRCTFKSNPAGAFIEVPDGAHVDGVVVFEDCVLRDCVFERVAILGTATAIRAARAGFGSPLKP